MKNTDTLFLVAILAATFYLGTQFGHTNGQIDGTEEERARWQKSSQVLAYENLLPDIRTAQQLKRVLDPEYDPDQMHGRVLASKIWRGNWRAKNL